MPRPALSVDTERQAPPSLSTLDSGGESPLDQSPAWQKTMSTLQRLYGDSPSGKGTRRLSFGDRAGRKSLILSSPELEKGDCLDARLGRIDNCNAEKNRSERRRRRSCTGVQQLMRQQRSKSPPKQGAMAEGGRTRRRSRDGRGRGDDLLPDHNPSLDSRGSEFDLGEFEVQLEKSRQIIDAADDSSNKASSYNNSVSDEDPLVLVDMDTGSEELVGVSGGGGGSEGKGNRRSARRSFQNSVERTHPNITTSQQVSPQMSDLCLASIASSEALEEMSRDSGGGKGEADFQLLPRKNRSSLRYAALTNSFVKGVPENGESINASEAGGTSHKAVSQGLALSVDIPLNSIPAGPGSESSVSSEQSDDSSSPGSKRRARLNTIYKKPVQRRRRKSFHGMDKMLHQQEHQSSKRMYTLPDFTSRALADSPPPAMKRALSGGGSPASGGHVDVDIGGRSPMDLHIVDHFLKEEGVRGEGEAGRHINKDGSPSWLKVEAFAIPSTRHLRQREGGLDFQLKKLGNVPTGQDAMKMDIDLESSFNADLSFNDDDDDEAGGGGDRADYRKHRATFEVGFLEKMRESLDMGGSVGGDDGGDDDEMSELDNFLAEESRGGAGYHGRGARRGSGKQSPKQAFGLDTIIGSPVSPTRGLNWGGRGGGKGDGGKETEGGVPPALSDKI
ncbi:hypothetical protein TrST_g368 [Triparma strigata]|uniref:Uncharacterized protein n=1 Tax=Triparma strigata TaxID=1606541 RepID=A0A9W7E3L5_9STRA|nr:hypothetical protein TrST_g368 [Triparma strigata]